MQPELQSPKLDWVGPGQAGRGSIDWFRCSAGSLRGPKSQYRIHRDELKVKTLLQGGNQLPGNYGERNRDYRDKTQTQRSSPMTLQHQGVVC